MASYPGTIATYTVKVPATTIQSAHINALQDEVVALETGLLSGLQHTLWGTQALRLSGQIQPPTIATQQNDYNPAGLSTCAVIRQQLGVASVTLTGLTAQPGGRVIAICCFGFSTGGLTLKNQSASSAAANQFVCPGLADLLIPPGGFATLWYDSTNSFWRVISNASTGGSAGPTFIGARVSNISAATALTAGVYATLSFSTVELNLGPMWSAGLPTRLTVPAGQGGVYWVYSKWPNSTNSILKSRFLKNGAVISSEVTLGSNANVPLGIVDTTILQLAAGDYLEVSAQSVVAGSAGGSGIVNATEFGAFKQNPT